MSKPVVYNWPAANTTAICALQDTAGAANLILNGSLIVPNYLSPIAVFVGISRTVSLTSLNNLAASNFTISGTLNGQAVSETRAGPNNNTVYTTQLFDSVTSVSVNGAVNGISVGSGTTGRTHWFSNNYHSTVLGMSVQVVVANTITYSFQTTLDDVQTIATPTVFSGIVIPQANNAQAFTTVMSAATATAMAGYLWPTRYSSILISAATDGSLVATFLQQGIT